MRECTGFASALMKISDMSPYYRNLPVKYNIHKFHIAYTLVYKTLASFPAIRSKVQESTHEDPWVSPGLCDTRISTAQR